MKGEWASFFHGNIVILLIRDHNAVLFIVCVGVGACFDVAILLSFFQTRHAIEKVLDWENSHLYHKVRKYGLLNIRITRNMLADGKNESKLVRLRGPCHTKWGF